MRHGSMILAAGMLIATGTFATAETLTTRVLDWDPVDRMITFEGDMQMQVNPDIAIEELGAGDQVTVLFEENEEGVDEVYQLTIVEDGDDAGADDAD